MFSGPRPDRPDPAQRLVPRPRAGACPQAGKRVFRATRGEEEEAKKRIRICVCVCVQPACELKEPVWEAASQQVNARAKVPERLVLSCSFQEAQHHKYPPVLQRLFSDETERTSKQI